MNTLTIHPRPRSVAWLGYGGLLPFVVTGIAAHLDPHHGEAWIVAQIAYGAVILSFVGALHWAFAMNSPLSSRDDAHRHFTWSVIPALLAWFALLLPVTSGLLLLLTGFWVHYLRDRRVATPAGLPAWYLPLRLQLTIVATVSLLASLIVGFGD